jgi:hypothetical protein
MRLSKQKRDKICEQILALLYHNFPKPLYTFNIAKEMARDEEFIKVLLLDLKDKSMTILVDKNKEGEKYKRRQRWRLSNQAYEVYSQKVSF